jgi:hypothetical protein
MRVSIGLDYRGEDVGIPHQIVDLTPRKGVFQNDSGEVRFGRVDKKMDVDSFSAYVEGVKIGGGPLTVGVRLYPDDQVSFDRGQISLAFDERPIPETVPIADIPGGEFEGAHMTPKPTECPHCGHVVFPGVLHLCEGQIR